MIKKYQIFLESRSTRSISISKEEAIKTIKDNCKDFLKDKSPKIFRGYLPQHSGMDNFLRVNPSEHERESANARNIYTLIMDNSPRWKDYPKRSKSIICTTSSSTADDYGHVYCVIPFDGSKIGLCPENDIWNSFKNVFGNHITLDHFVYGLHQSGVSDKSYNDMVKGFGKLQIEMIKSFQKEKSQIWSFITMLSGSYGTSFKSIELLSDMYKNALNENPNLSLYNFVESLLDPKSNGFMLSSYSDVVGDDKEVWTDSNCIMIYEPTFNSILKELD